MIHSRGHKILIDDLLARESEICGISVAEHWAVRQGEKSEILLCGKVDPVGVGVGANRELKWCARVWRSLRYGAHVAGTGCQRGHRSQSGDTLGLADAF